MYHNMLYCITLY